MRIISWNCHYGFDKNKPKAIKKLEADILVIPECRNKDMKNYSLDEKHRDWYGDQKEAKNRNGKIIEEKDLGIGIFWNEGITLIKLPEFENICKNEKTFRYVVPYKVEGKFKSFTLVAVWTKAEPYYYDRNVIEAVSYYKSKGLFNNNTIIIGDYNTFDKNNNQRLEGLEKDLSSFSMINCAKKSNFHKESTFISSKDGDGIDDFCFISENFDCKNIKFTTHNDWKEEKGKKHWNGSDHCPISVEFDID